MKTSIVFLLAICVTVANAQIRVYPLDGDATETVSGQDGTPGIGTEAPTDTTDRFGNPSGAMFFDGTDLIEIPSTGLLNDEFSVSAWLMVSQNPPSLQMNYFAVGSNEDQAFGVANDLFGNGFFQAGYVDVGTPIRVFDAGLPTEDVWYHVTVTRSLTDLTLYINGHSVANTDATGTLPVYGISPTFAFIGSRSSSSGFWNGVIDDLRIWDHALTQQEVDIVNSVQQPVLAPFTISPNPSNGVFTLEELTPGSFLEVYDSSGRIVLDLLVDMDNTTIDLTGLPNGCYIISMNTGTSIGHQRVIKTGGTP